jgi:TonB family protein
MHPLGRRFSLRFALVAAVIVFLALFAIRPWFRPQPVKVTLAVGARRTLPVQGPAMRTVLGAQGIVRFDRDRRGRLVIVGEKRGATDLRVFEGSRLAHHYEIEVKPPPPRKIEVVAKRIPKKRPRRLVARHAPPPELTVPPPRLEPPPAPTPPPALAEKRPDQKVKEKKKEEKRAEEPKKTPPEKQSGKKMVELDEANKKIPRDARYLAQEDSAVARETRAVDTTLLKTDPGKEQPDGERRKDRMGEEKPRLAGDKERAPRARREKRLALLPREAQEEVPPRPASAPEPRESRARDRLADRGATRHDEYPGGPPRRFRLFPSAQEIAAILRQTPRPASAPEQAQEGEEEPISRMPGGKWAKIWQRVRGFLENFIPEVRPGTHTALNARRHAFAAYIARAHRKIHSQWGYGLWHNFRDLPDPEGRSPYYSSVYARLEIKLDKKGRVVRVGLVKTSGHNSFDGGAMASVLAAAPFGPPPSEMVSGDGITYLHWNFYQDGRQCWTNDVQVFVKES